MASSSSDSFSFSSPSTPEQPRVPIPSIRGTVGDMTSGSAIGTSPIVQVDSVANTSSVPPPPSIPPPPVDTQARQPEAGRRTEEIEDNKTRSGRKYQGRRSRKSAAAPLAADPTISESHSDRAGVDSESMHTSNISIVDSEDSENIDEHARMATSSYRHADRRNRT